MEILSTRLVREKGPDLDTKVGGPREVAEIAGRLLEDADREHFLVFTLNAANEVTGYNVVTVGILDASLVHPREVFKAAILANASSVIAVHNHPSGDPVPSPEDRAVTRQLRDAGKLVGIPLTDHVIVGTRGRWTSMLDEGDIR